MSGGYFANAVRPKEPGGRQGARPAGLRARRVQGASSIRNTLMELEIDLLGKPTVFRISRNGHEPIVDVDQVEAVVRRSKPARSTWIRSAPIRCGRTRETSVGRRAT
jgi:hypothetical protein